MVSKVYYLIGRTSNYSVQSNPHVSSKGIDIPHVPEVGNHGKFIFQSETDAPFHVAFAI
jgi:hypothetical protein